MGRIGKFEVEPRARVIIDNDFAGDPDDLFQTAHHLLCPSVEIRGIIGSHLSESDPFDHSGKSAEHAVRRLGELLRTMGMDGKVPVHRGAEKAIEGLTKPRESAAAEAIVSEALREDTKLPLYVVCGGGLTDLASALMMDGRIAERMTVVWIGGMEHPGLALPPPNSGSEPEYNLNIDVEAGRYLFNESSVPLWQVPRNIYRQAMVSLAELEARVRPCGEVGRFLCDALEGVTSMVGKLGMSLGETYILGDSPLVLLTALQSPFQPDPSSSDYVLRERPTMGPGGLYGLPSGRGQIRVYTRIDTRLMFEDFFTKLRAFA
jgi:purine nucleosidase